MLTPKELKTRRETTNWKPYTFSMHLKGLRGLVREGHDVGATGRLELKLGRHPTKKEFDEAKESEQTFHVSADVYEISGLTDPSTGMKKTLKHRHVLGEKVSINGSPYTVSEVCDGPRPKHSRLM